MSDQLGTKEHPCTRENSSSEERYLAFCQCAKCGLVDRYLPWTPFSWTPKGLVCWTCNPDKPPTQAS